MKTFQIIALTPPGLSDPSIAIAACRAFELGVLNLEYTNNVNDAMYAINKMAKYSINNCGIRLDGNLKDFFKKVTTNLPKQVTTVILAGSPKQLLNKNILNKQVQALKKMNLKILFEAISVKQAQIAHKAGVNGIIAKGNETGGWVGEETTSILLQRIKSEISSLPVLVYGGIGLYSAAAYYTAGVSGLVLDSQLWLAKESTISASVLNTISTMDGSKTICLGENINAPYRIYARTGFEAVNNLKTVEKDLIVRLSSKNPSKENTIIKTWYSQINSRVGFLNQDQVLNIGQDAAFASGLAKRFKTVSGIIQGIRLNIDEQIKTAVNLKPFNKNSPLAVSHKTKYPIVQGPMANVSDCPKFICKVAKAGALPFLALGRLNASKVDDLFKKTSKILGNRPFGAGILGFVPKELYKEQFEVIKSYHPAFVIIAGGYPDKAKAFRKEGINAYLHTPSPGLLELFLKRGERHFVFEGSESGGHIGPRASYILFNQMVEILLNSLPKENRQDCHVLFAGGIHNALSSAMVATMAAPLAQVGIRTGLLLGTSYLFTKEILQTGAIINGYQTTVQKCNQTALLKSIEGHAIRCAYNKYVEYFNQIKKDFIKNNKSDNEIRIELEKLSIGRLRTASKGIAYKCLSKENSEAENIKLKKSEQIENGIFMLGQSAVLNNKTFTLANLHKEVSETGSQILDSFRKTAVYTAPLRAKIEPIDIAIVGMSSVFPKAPNLQSFWDNIMNGINAVTEVPKEYWNKESYYSADSDNKNDKFDSKWGGFIDPVPFDCAKFGIPPNRLSQIAPFQLLSLELVRQALKNAGYDKRPYPNELTSVILGMGTASSELTELLTLRTRLSEFFSGDCSHILSCLPEWTEDSFAGFLSNITAGRISNRFNFGGGNFVIDAACASSLAALYSAAEELVSGKSYMAITGGIDTSQNPFTYFCFSKTHALSKTGVCRPFDKEADGTVIGEGIAVVILKRLKDAKRDGDTIYSVIKSVGMSSSGRNMSITASCPEGLQRALQRAYEDAGISPSTISLVEAHGTATQAGDKAELQSLKQVFKSNGSSEKSCALGSVKSMIGHTKGTAGMAGLIKIALSLHNKVLPQTLGVKNPHENLNNSPFYINSLLRPWIKKNNKYPRRAGISSFGFGGTNFHAVIEEYTDGYLKKDQLKTYKSWPSELFMWVAESLEELISQIEIIINLINKSTKFCLSDLAYTLFVKNNSGNIIFDHKKNAGLNLNTAGTDVDSDNSNISADKNVLKLAVIALSVDNLYNKLIKAKKLLLNSKCDPINDPEGIYFNKINTNNNFKTAFLFAGQGSQYPGMLSDLAVNFDCVRKSFETANFVLSGQTTKDMGIINHDSKKGLENSQTNNSFSNKSLSSYIFPPPFFNEKEKTESQFSLNQTNIAQPAVAASDIGCFHLMKEFNIKPDMVLGHSFGEYAAICAAGYISEETLYYVSEARGHIINEESLNYSGSMAAVISDMKTVSKIIKMYDDVWIANLNSPEQTIITGTEKGISKAVKEFSKIGVLTNPVAVSCAFHSPLMNSSKNRLAKVLKGIDFKNPDIEVISNTYAASYPKGQKQIRELLAEHLIKPIDFIKQIKTMYEKDVRIFIEVGPHNILTNLTRKILKGRKHLVIALDNPNRHGLTQLQHTLAQLAVNGVSFKAETLYENRELKLLNINKPEEFNAEQMSDTKPTVWMVNGKEATPALKSGSKNSTKPFEKINLSENSTVNHVPTVQEKILLRHQKLMKHFVDVQHNIMNSYLSANNSTLSNDFIDKFSDINEIDNKELTKEFFNIEEKSSGELIEDLIVNTELPDKEKIVEDILSVISEQTGYPTEMLGLDLNLEADLSIDSIKRIEIFGIIMQKYIRIDKNEEKHKVEELAKIKTIRGIISWIHKVIEEENEKDIKVDNKEGPEKIQKTVDSKLEDENKRDNKTEDKKTIRLKLSLKSVKSLKLLKPENSAKSVLKNKKDKTAFPVPLFDKGSLFLITDDEKGTAASLADNIKLYGGSSVIVKMGNTLKKNKKNTYICDLTNPEMTGKLYDKIKSDLGFVTGIIHLLPLRDKKTFEQMKFSDWQYSLNTEVKSLFYLAKAALKDLEDNANSKLQYCISATSMGGTLGVENKDKKSWFPGHGGVLGLIKTLAIEWPTVKCKALDFSQDLGNKSIVNKIIMEMLYNDSYREVGYFSKKRVIPNFVTAELDLENHEKSNIINSLNSDCVIMATGGARGITFEAVYELAKHFQSKILLVGRSLEPLDEESAETNELTSQNEIKKVIINNLEQNKKTFSLKEVESLYQQLLKDREIRSNLKLLKQTGSEIYYHSIDVCDEQKFGDFICDIYKQYGRLDGIIHGAGIIEDKLVRDKKPDSFNRVLNTKTKSAFVIAKNVVPKKLSFFILYSSISGVTGNLGQSDYAAANEILNKLAVYLNSSWPTNVMAINWGPWTKTGLVEELIVKKFKSLGIEPLTAIEGRNLFMNELRYLKSLDSEVILFKVRKIDKDKNEDDFSLYEKLSIFENDIFGELNNAII